MIDAQILGQLQFVEVRADALVLCLIHDTAPLALIFAEIGNRGQWYELAVHEERDVGPLMSNHKCLARSLIGEKTADNTRATTKQVSKKINFQSLNRKALADMEACVKLGKG